MRQPPLDIRPEAGRAKRAGWWSYLEAHSDQPEFQELIRREIFRGAIRVVPGDGGRVRIIPLGVATRERDCEVPPLRTTVSLRRDRQAPDGRATAPLVERIRM